MLEHLELCTLPLMSAAFQPPAITPSTSSHGQAAPTYHLVSPTRLLQVKQEAGLGPGCASPIVAFIDTLIILACVCQDHSGIFESTASAALQDLPASHSLLEGRQIQYDLLFQKCQCWLILFACLPLPIVQTAAPVEMAPACSLTRMASCALGMLFLEAMPLPCLRQTVPCLMVVQYEEDVGTTSWRHTNTGGIGGPHLDALRKLDLVIRSVSTIGNYGACNPFILQGYRRSQSCTEPADLMPCPTATQASLQCILGSLQALGCLTEIVESM